ncbi:MAG: hypothetical protein CHACPFDD_01896 [Phycisphaerae bacterium]|nr:hypothetical protein [Phycisphaerae bacterium]
MTIPPILRDMLSLPTAPFLEQAVLESVRQCCARLKHVTLSTDRYGNILARYSHSPQSRTPLVFTAHTDHPGFVSTTPRSRGTLRAEFRGWVEPDYFIGTGVRFWSDGAWVKGRVRTITKPGELNRFTGRTPPPKELAIAVSNAVAPNSPGMWDLPDPRTQGECVAARGCDDLAGAAALLALLERLARRRARAEAYCLFTRAEEVGFIGAIGAARLGTIPRGLPVIAIETSKALPNAPQGAGPILRVGDRTSIFSPGLTAFCERVAASLARRRKSFRFQRKLMDGGTCESTAFLTYGYDTTGICVALGNYHNMDERRRRIASETIDLNDWRSMVDWFEALVLDLPGYAPAPDDLRRRLDERFKGYEPLLRKSAAAAASRSPRT